MASNLRSVRAISDASPRPPESDSESESESGVPHVATVGAFGVNGRPNRRAHPSTLPVTGAWRPGDPEGNRKFVEMAADRPFILEGGGSLSNITIAYEAWGELDAQASNAILVCHALTGDAHAFGGVSPGHRSPGWWNGLIGPGCALDTDRYFVVCVNVLGGCQGSTGPASPHPDDGQPYGSRFPVVSIRDIVRCQSVVADRLGVKRWLAVVGGSMGGMQVIEWAVMFPDRVRAIIPIATAMAASAQQIAYGAVGRKTIALDPRWRGGDYYDAEPGDGPHESLAIARAIAQITYRSDDVFTDRFGREPVESLDGFSMWQRFEVERYLEYHGDKLVRRFDANSYLILSKAMDLHDVGRGRGGIAAAVSRIEARTLAVGITSDVLYPRYQQLDLCEALRAEGKPWLYTEIDSPHGHDAFLIELDQLGAAITDFLAKVESNR